MATVTELVTEFKFKGDTKPLKEAGDQMQRVSENSGIAEKRMDGAGDSFLGLNKKATIAVAGLAGLATAVAKTAEGILNIGAETDSLLSLGVNVAELRDFQDLFVEMGAGAEDASFFVKEITKAQGELARGKTPEFIRQLNEGFGVSINRADSLSDILNKLRTGVLADRKLQDPKVLSTLLQDVGFDPGFSKVLLATEDNFQKAIKASQNYAKVTNEQLKLTQEVNEEWGKLIAQLGRINDKVLVEFADEMLKIIKFTRKLIGGDLELKGFRRGSGMGMAGLDAPVLRDRQQNFAPFEQLRLRGGSPASPAKITNVTNNITISGGDIEKMRRFLKGENNRTRGQR